MFQLRNKKIIFSYTLILGPGEALTERLYNIHVLILLHAQMVFFIFMQRYMYTDPHFQHNCFRNVTLIDIRGFAEIIVPARGYGRHSPNQVMIKRE